jgi:hypothetical protein
MNHNIGAKYFSSILLFIFLTSNVCLAQVDSTSKDSLLLKQIEEQMKTTPPQVTQQTRSSLSFNPDIGVIGDFQGFLSAKAKEL